MSSAFGVFQIVANDGRQDHMLMATELLNQRIERIKQVRRSAGFDESEVYPTLLDIERTHIIFVTAHFKPFAAIAFEYHRVDPDSARQLNSSMKYSIPQYGDFFADMAHYVRFNQLTYTSGVAAATVDADGLPVTGGLAIYGQGNPNADVFRYCDFPGERLHERVKFTVNGNPLDQYTRDAYVMYRQFQVAPNKQDGYYRLVGQELPHEAYLDQEVTTQPQSRVAMTIVDGYQTPSSVHDALEVTVPLLFWFCKDFRLSVPSVAIPYGQRWVEIKMADSASLVELVAPSGSANNDSTALGPLEIADAALYVNNLFVNSEVHDVFIRRIGFTLIRVHLYHEEQLTQSAAKIKLDSLQWPIEAMFFGFRPIVNYDLSQATTLLASDSLYSRTGGYGTLQNWHRFSNITLDRESVYGVQSSRVDTLAEAEMQVLATYARANTATALTNVTVLNPATVGSLPAYLAANLHSDGQMHSRWGLYAMAAIKAHGQYVGSVLGSASGPLVVSEMLRIVNEFAETKAWSNVALISSGTAAAQVTAYNTAIAAFDALSDTSTTQITRNLNIVIARAAASYGATSQTVFDAVQLSGFLGHSIVLGNTAIAEVRRASPTVSTVGLQAHNVKLYDAQYEAFFNSYLTYVYGGPNINTPKDRGLYLISFALYPGTYQPSGHINISRAREFYITYQSVRPITASNPVQLLVYVSAINFLLIADGSASLRYTT
jgi:hypothetical protein